MKTWTDDIDPATIPDEIIIRERAKRNNAKRQTLSGGEIWKHHNPDTARCRCVACNRKRDRRRATALKNKRPPGRPRKEVSK
jgi:hypothetical protein